MGIQAMWSNITGLQQLVAKTEQDIKTAREHCTSLRERAHNRFEKMVEDMKELELQSQQAKRNSQESVESMTTLLTSITSELSTLRTESMNYHTGMMKMAEGIKEQIAT